ncbi:hypothetical protein GCM10011504_58760 [Siccirubricoccus deserti]|nr:hypothetical protein GCM10011504_58760 [Siccirubricoccus deserti]
MHTNGKAASRTNILGQKMGIDATFPLSMQKLRCPILARIIYHNYAITLMCLAAYCF